jgi:hypothetical protein
MMNGVRDCCRRLDKGEPMDFSTIVIGLLDLFFDPDLHFRY